MQQNVFENKFNIEYALLTIIKPGMAIEFTIKCANDVYLDLNNSCLLRYKSKRIKTSMITSNPINLTLHLMFRAIDIELIGRNVCNERSLPVSLIPEEFAQLCKETL